METTAALLQQIVEEQTLYTNKKLVFNFSDLAALNTFSAFVKNNSYTGITLTYDPNGENVNVLDCAITASTDYEAEMVRKTIISSLPSVIRPSRITEPSRNIRTDRQIWGRTTL